MCRHGHYSYARGCTDVAVDGGAAAGLEVALSFIIDEDSSALIGKAASTFFLNLVPLIGASILTMRVPFLATLVTSDPLLAYSLPSLCSPFTLLLPPTSKHLLL